MKGYLTEDGVLIKTAELEEKLKTKSAINTFFKSLITVEKKDPSRAKMYGMADKRIAYKEHDDFIIIPKQKANEMLGMMSKAGKPFLDELIYSRSLIKINEEFNRPEQLAIPDEYKTLARAPFDYQTTIVEHLDKLNKDILYLQCETGTGKSSIAALYVIKKGLKCLWICPTELIVTQSIDEFSKMYPKLRVALFENKNIGRKKNPNPIPQTHDVVFCIINTFRAKDSDFVKGYGCIVFDEAHELCSRENSKALWLASSIKHTLGLSATPNVRPDGMDLYVYHHLGDPIYALTDIKDVSMPQATFNVSVQVYKYTCPEEFAGNEMVNGVISSILTISKMVKDQFRCIMIAKMISEAYRADTGVPGTTHSIIAFCELREYVMTIQSALLSQHDPSDIVLNIDDPVDDIDESVDDITDPVDDIDESVDGIDDPVDVIDDITEANTAIVNRTVTTTTDISILRGGTDISFEELSKKKSQIALATYSFARRGISIKALTTLFLCTPRRSGLQQVIGRILRLGSNVEIPRIIYDFVDMGNSLSNQYSSRKKVYRSRNYPIIEKKLLWSDFN